MTSHESTKPLMLKSIFLRFSYNSIYRWQRSQYLIMISNEVDELMCMVLGYWWMVRAVLIQSQMKLMSVMFSRHLFEAASRPLTQEHFCRWS